MEAKIMAFGKVAAVTGKSDWKWKDIKDTTALKERLEKAFPELKSMQYLIAVNKKIATTAIALEDQAEIALLPPYSGG